MAAFPAYPDLDKSPTLEVWGRSELGRDWQPPACTGWTASGFTTLVVLAARFRHTSGVEGLLRRIGSISELAGMRYWSTSHRRWQQLIVGACALEASASHGCRRDFSAEEMVEGRNLFFQQADNLSGKATYRMHIGSLSPDRLVLDIENISTLRYLAIPLFRPGEMQSIYFLERESEGIWRYYSLTRVGKNASALIAGRESSSINRAAAFYRHLTGLPTDMEPPVSP